MAKLILNWVTIVVALALIFCANDKAQANFEAEVSNLAEMFSNSLGSVSLKLGGAGTNGQPMGSSEADTKMLELYSNMEKALMDARQLSANARSALISSKIESLRL